MKNLKVVLLLVVAMLFVFSGPVFAATSLADVQEKLKAAKSAGVTTLADVQAQLRKAKNEEELSKIGRIARNFGISTNELHALKLVKGNGIGDISKAVSNSGFLRIGKIVEANGLTMPECRKLPVGFVFYIPTKFIDKGLVLNAYEVALLKRELANFKEMAKRLTGENKELTRTIADKEKEIAGLTGELKAEKEAHAITADKLATKAIQSSRLGEKTVALETKSANWMMIAIVAIIIAILLTVYFLFLRNGKRDRKIVEKVIKEHQIKKDTPLTA